MFVADGRRYTTRAYTHGSNAAGLHERELPAAPDPDVRRVVVLGDSMTWGTGTAAEAWPRVMEEALGPPWQAVNLAQYGYDAAQSAAALRVQGWAYAPERVIFAAYQNDLVPTRLITVGEPPTHAWLGDGGLLPSPLRHGSALLRAVEGAWMARGATEVEDPEALRAALRDLAGQAREHDVPLLVVEMAPHVLATADPAACDRLAGAPGRCARALDRAARIEALTRAEGLPYASVLPALRAAGAEAWFPANPHDWEHPSPAGQAVVGRAVAEIVRDWVAAGKDAPPTGEPPGAPRRDPPAPPP